LPQGSWKTDFFGIGIFHSALSPFDTNVIKVQYGYRAN